MSSSKSAPRLGTDLIARKGEAAPIVPPIPIEPEIPAVPLTEKQSQTTSTPRGVAGNIAVSVRLDPERYERLKIHGAKSRRTNQDILVEALDDYLNAKA